MEKLKKCPFCGSENIKIVAILNVIANTPVREYKVLCGDCDASAGTHINSRDASVKAWNRRSE